MSDETKVVDLAGRPVARRVEPVSAIVEQLESLLDEARRGDIRGLAVAVVGAEKLETLWAFDPTSSMKFELLAEADLMQARILRSLEDSGTDR